MKNGSISNFAWMFAWATFVVLVDIILSQFGLGTSLLR